MSVDCKFEWPVFYLVAAWVREARVVVSRAPWSLRMCVYEFMAAAQYYSQTVGRFSPNSSCGACRPALGKPFGSFQILRHVASSLESIVVIDVGGSDTRPCV